MSLETYTISYDTCTLSPGRHLQCPNIVYYVLVDIDHVIFHIKGVLYHVVFASAMISTRFNIVRCRSCCTMYMYTLSMCIDTFNTYAIVLLYLFENLFMSSFFGGTCIYMCVLLDFLTRITRVYTSKSSLYVTCGPGYDHKY
jgi:hypothetical protein